MSNVERDDLSVFVVPHHGALPRVSQCVVPDVPIELWDSHTHQTVATVTIGERQSENFVQRIDIARLRSMRAEELSVMERHIHIAAGQRPP